MINLMTITLLALTNILGFWQTGSVAELILSIMSIALFVSAIIHSLGRKL